MREANSDERVLLTWHGAANYHIRYRNLKTVIDPLYSRLPGDRPHLSVSREDLDRIDFLLLTHIFFNDIDDPLFEVGDFALRNNAFLSQQPIQDLLGYLLYFI